jgi:hypothetical protein
MRVNNKKSHTLIDNKGQGAQSHLSTQYQEESRRRSVLRGQFFCDRGLDFAGLGQPNTCITLVCRKSHTLIDNKGQGAQSHLSTQYQEESRRRSVLRSALVQKFTQNDQHRHPTRKFLYCENSTKHLTSDETCP